MLQSDNVINSSYYAMLIFVYKIDVIHVRVVVYYESVIKVLIDSN